MMMTIVTATIIGTVVLVCVGKVFSWIEKDATEWAKKNPKIPGYPGDYA